MDKETMDKFNMIEFVVTPLGESLTLNGEKQPKVICEFCKHMIGLVLGYSLELRIWKTIAIGSILVAIGVVIFLK